MAIHRGGSFHILLRILKETPASFYLSGRAPRRAAKFRQFNRLIRGKRRGQKKRAQAFSRFQPTRMARSRIRAYMDRHAPGRFEERAMNGGRTSGHALLEATFRAANDPAENSRRMEPS